MKRRGDTVLSIVLAGILSMFVLQGLFQQRQTAVDRNEVAYVLEELALVGNVIERYLATHRENLLENENFARNAGDDTKVFIPTSSFMNTEFESYIPTETAFASLKNLWGDKYKVVFIRSASPKNSENLAGDEALTDALSAYVLATGGTRKERSSGTSEGDMWLSIGMRKAAMSGGTKFGYVEGGKLIGGGFATDLGVVDAGAVNGDLGYMVQYDIESMTSGNVLRYPTGDDEDQTMHADIDMNDNNVLDVRYFESQSMDVGSVRFDPTLYTSATEAESSCRNNWTFIRSKTGDRLYVSSKGKVYAEWTDAYKAKGTALGTLGMNGGAKEEEMMADETMESRLDTLGRVYYISPTTADIPGETGLTDSTISNEVFATKSQLAVCKMINGKRTLAYIGDNRTEDKISFVVSAVDGDYIPPFFCPGQDVNVAGGGTNSLKGRYSVTHVQPNGTLAKKMASETLFNSGKNTEFDASSKKTKFTQGIAPRLFVVPQFVTTGKKSFPIQGIRAWAETVDPNGSIARGWIVRLNALIDRQNGPLGTRSYWIGNIAPHRRVDTPENAISNRRASSTVSGYATTRELNEYAEGTISEFAESSGSAATSVEYLRAIVIGVCSGKLATF